MKSANICRIHVLSCFLGCLIASASNGQKIYWVQSNGYLRRADLDGSNAETVIQLSEGGIALAVHGAAGKLYWTGANKIRRANLDGSGIEIVFNSTGDPWGIALDVSAGKMYWSERSGGRIRRADLNGSAMETLVVGAVSPRGIALDLNAAKMYWIANTVEIHRASLDGSSVETLFAEQGIPIQSVAVDSVHDKVYWMRRTDLWGEFAAIRRANLDGSNVETLISWPDEVYLQTIALAVERNEMYWSENIIFRAALDGTGVAGLAAPSFQPRGIALDLPCCPPFGDIIPEERTSADPCLVDVDDLSCILVAFQYPGTCPGADLYPCGGDGVIDVDDILAELAAFSGYAMCETTCK